MFNDFSINNHLEDTCTFPYQNVLRDRVILAVDILLRIKNNCHRGQYISSLAHLN